MRLTAKKIKQIACKNGLIIAIGHPMEWGIVCQRKRAYSYSIMDNFGFWHEPENIDAYNLRDLYYNVLQLIDNG
jgi:hypothetical protein